MKQKELQPWTTKINTKQTEIDIATSERDALAKKTTIAKEAMLEAQSSLETLQADQKAKVILHARTAYLEPDIFYRPLIWTTSNPVNQKS